MGGGHGDYWGNESYALNLSGTPAMVRLDDPSPDFGFNNDPADRAANCREELADGKISSRHTYDAFEYLADRDQAILVGGSVSRCGFFANDTWLLDLDDVEWHKQTTTGTPPGKNVLACAYDPVSTRLYCHDTAVLSSYDAGARVWTRLSNHTVGTDYHLTGVIHPVRRLFVLFGNNQAWKYDLSAVGLHVLQALSTTGGEALLAKVYPGLAYHPPSGKILGWAGGDTVYSLDLDTGVWTPHTYHGGPEALGNGTYQRWSWVPSLGAFVVVNSVDANAFLFRLP